MSSTLIRSVLRRLDRSSDYERWASSDAISQDWLPRTIRIAELIQSNSRVVEFGAGAGELQKHLPDGCIYVGYDLHPRSPAIRQLDLNRRPLSGLATLNADTAVFAGVLEYLWSPLEVIQWLASAGIRRCLASYECAHSRPYSARRLVEIAARANEGWYNTFTESDVTELFAQAGYSCLGMTDWPGATVGGFIFDFVRDSRVAR